MKVFDWNMADGWFERARIAHRRRFEDVEARKMHRQPEKTVSSVLDPPTTDKSSGLVDNHSSLHGRKRSIPVEADPVSGLEGLRRAEERR
jgi:hypothetical protein